MRATLRVSRLTYLDVTGLYMFGRDRQASVVDIDTSARISGRPAIPPFQGGGVLQGLVWVSYRLTCGKWSNGLIPH